MNACSLNMPHSVLLGEITSSVRAGDHGGFLERARDGAT